MRSFKFDINSVFFFFLYWQNFILLVIFLICLLNISYVVCFKIWGYKMSMILAGYGSNSAALLAFLISSCVHYSGTTSLCIQLPLPLWATLQPTTNPALPFHAVSDLIIVISLIINACSVLSEGPAAALFPSTPMEGRGGPRPERSRQI